MKRLAIICLLLSPASIPAQERGCADATETWLGLRVCEESGERSGYDRRAFGSSYNSKEDEIIKSLPHGDGWVLTPYTCAKFAVASDWTAATDIDHVVSLAEAYDSGLAPGLYRTFAGDIDNLTIAAPHVNRNQKSDRDAGEWAPARNRAWFALRVIMVKHKYRLSVDVAERDALASLLRELPERAFAVPGLIPWCGEMMVR